MACRNKRKTQNGVCLLNNCLCFCAWFSALFACLVFHICQRKLTLIPAWCQFYFNFFLLFKLFSGLLFYSFQDLHNMEKHLMQKILLHKNTPNNVFFSRSVSNGPMYIKFTPDISKNPKKYRKQISQ